MRALLVEIEHHEQRYSTCGDWEVEPDGFVTISVSRMDNEDYVFLVQLHEMAEAYLCKKRGIEQAVVDEFDIRYEVNRPEGDESEPGDDPRAPYYKEHQFATAIERFMAEELGVNWDEYSKVVASL
jgi:hypothetical protein